MNWIIGGIFGVVRSIMLFVVVTDGRYFGKRLTYWLYNRFGAAMFGSRSEAARWRQLAEALAWRGDETILDLGTAVGDLPLTLAALPDFSGFAVGLDWSPQMMTTAWQEAARRGVNGRTAFGVADAREPLPFHNDSFDIITCLGLLETLPHPNQILHEMVRILQPDGKLALSLYRGWSALGASLSLNWYQKQLQPLGFDLQIIELRRNHDIVIGQKIDD